MSLGSRGQDETQRVHQATPPAFGWSPGGQQSLHPTIIAQDITLAQDFIGCGWPAGKAALNAHSQCGKCNRREKEIPMQATGKRICPAWGGSKGFIKKLFNVDQTKITFAHVWKIKQCKRIYNKSSH